MQLKEYQQSALNILSDYLRALKEAQAKADQIAQLGLDIPFEWDRAAWKKGERDYIPRKNGLGQPVPKPVPTVCLKVPTGGGKTLLAVRAIDAIQTLYRGRQTGLVLWLVPTTQIYRQTLQALRDRAHPYRQALDLSSGGRTLILEKDSRFSPDDVQTQLVVMLLMLPSANRQNKETLRLFQDQGGFEPFFPAEDQLASHVKLREHIPNLDVYDHQSMLGGVVKSSLGNTLRLLNPVMIVDEGHKAYSATAQQTLRGFNPSFILELSATPPRESNVLVNITGQSVLREGMIKLDLHVHNKASADWRDTVLAACRHRAELEQIAQTYQANHGLYIRPIALFQVERTGAKQRLPGLIHVEDVREYLITRLNVLPEEIAVKSSERDEIENIDLLSSDCPIRYIITKQALQEGWDCPFAYIVTILTNPESNTAMTQLIGRVLRQPYARKTGLPELDESHVYCFKAKTGQLLDTIRAGLIGEGLGDVAGRVIADVEAAPSQAVVDVSIRPQFQHYAGKVYLPCFVVSDGKGGWREVGYEVDILSRVDWEQVDLSPVDSWELNPAETGDSHVSLGLDHLTTIEPLRASLADEMQLDPVFMTRQLLDLVPNPWVAYEYVEETLRRLRAKFPEARIKRDLGFVIEELKKRIAAEQERLTRQVFDSLLQSGELRFYLISGCAGSAIPERIKAKAGARKLTTATGDLPARTLFDYFLEEDFNETEKAVALYLDQQADILEWWFRNNVGPNSYSIQGWRRHRPHPDFFALRQEPPTIYVLETKGIHLGHNPDTDYKKQLFELCNKYSQPTPWNDITQEFSGHRVNFQIVFDDEWQRVLNAMLTST
ncbi:MAG: restriction endonuclease subunit R [Anaerolineae bacterium]|nr:restriction endonuclease subunit R [Anaerolineae bacterium]